MSALEQAARSGAPRFWLTCFHDPSINLEFPTFEHACGALASLRLARLCEEIANDDLEPGEVAEVISTLLEISSGDEFAPPVEDLPLELSFPGGDVWTISLDPAGARPTSLPYGGRVE